MSKLSQNDRIDLEQYKPLKLDNVTVIDPVEEYKKSYSPPKKQVIPAPVVSVPVEDPLQALMRKTEEKILAESKAQPKNTFGSYGGAVAFVNKEAKSE